MIPSAENPVITVGEGCGEGGGVFLNPEEGLRAALLASPAAGTFAFLVAAFAVHSTSFIAVTFKHKITHV